MLGCEDEHRGNLRVLRQRLEFSALSRRNQTSIRSDDMSQSSDIKLSICITTFNRAAFIAETLESILVQLTSECEVVVLDGASTDRTEAVVSEYTRRFDRLRYVRQNFNNGFDRDSNRVVELALGEYCWLMTDDDLLKPGAVAAVLQALCPDRSMIVVNAESRDLSMSRTLQARWLPFEEDRLYGANEMDRLVFETGHILKYVGCIVIRRTIWLARAKEPYYGSLFTYLGVIFQQNLPGNVLVIAQPFISYRMGNVQTWSSKAFETFAIKLPAIVGSLSLSESARSKLCNAQPWRSVRDLLWYRARGSYSLAEYRQWIRPRCSSLGALAPLVIALLPGVLVNVSLVLFYRVFRGSHRGVWQPEMVLQMLSESRFGLRKSHRCKRN